MRLSSEKQKYGKPLCAKSRIVVLGNFEDHLCQKSQRYAPVLKYISLRLLIYKSVGDKHILQKGHFNNTLCNANLTDNEVNVIRSPIGNPDLQEDEYWLLKKTLYGLRRSPIIGTIRSKEFCSRWASRPQHTTHDSFLVYLPNHLLLRPSQKINPNSTLASMLTIVCFIPQIQPMRTYSRHYSKNKSKSISWEMLTIFRYCIYLAPSQRREHFYTYMPVDLH